MNYYSKPPTSDSTIGCEHALDISVRNFAHTFNAKYVTRIVDCGITNENENQDTGDKDHLEYRRCGGLAAPCPIELQPGLSAKRPFVRLRIFLLAEGLNPYVI